MNTEYDYDEELENLLNQALPEELASSGMDTEHFTGMQVSDILGEVWERVENRIQEPFEVLSLLAGVILLSALAESFSTQKTAVSKICDVIAVLCASVTAVRPVTEVFLKSGEVLEQSANFMTVFSGIFGGVLAVSGHVTASAGYQGAVLFLCDIALEIATKILFPILTMGICISLADGVNPEMSLGGILNLMQRVSIWLNGILMALFLGFLSVQSVVAVSADRAGTKAVKYAISGFVPFVGGAVSDAYTAVLGSMGVVKSTAGMTGVMAVVLLLLPVIIDLFLYKVLMTTAGTVSEIFAQEGLSKLFRNLEKIISIGFSVAVSFGVMFVVSTGLLMTLSN